MIHKLIEDKLNEWVKEDEPYGYGPKKSSEVKAVCFESRTPIDSHHSEQTMTTVTRWGNGEGFDISIGIYNQLTKEDRHKHFSFHTTEIDGILYCLKDLKYFE